MQAFLAIWSDIDEDGADQWYRWHTEEHMPERVAIPGFLAGRRYERIDEDLGHDVPRDRRLQHCFMMYEGERLSVFNSDAYIERLNHPTAWTRKVSPSFTNFSRGACQLGFSAGEGYGGAVLLLRFDADAAAEELSDMTLDGLADFLTTLPGRSSITAVHFGICRPEITDVETSEKRARQATGEAAFRSVLMIEACDLQQLVTDTSAIMSSLTATGLPIDGARYGFFRISYLLTRGPTQQPNQH